MNIRTFSGCALSCLGLLLAGPAGAQTFFTEVTDAAFERPRFGSRSAAFADYDNDGRPDMFLGGFSWKTSTDYPISLLHNEGNGKFANQKQQIHAEIPGVPKGGGAVFGDYDNDGDLDLFVPVGAIFYDRRNVLLRNDRGIFIDVALEAGLTDALSTDNAIWLDYDRDGHLDLYAGDLGFPEERNKLYRNKGDGTFKEVTEEAGLDIQLHPTLGGSNGGMAAGDFNGDGWPDLYLGVFRAPNRLFLNDQKGGFQEATTNELADPGEAFGLAVGDIDRDGDLDLFQTSGVNGRYRSSMFLNLGEGVFLDVTEGVGLTTAATAGLQGANLGDIDNDGDLDLITLGNHFLFLNTGDGTFVDQTARSGIGAVNQSLSFGDYDLDGFLDAWFGTTSFNESVAYLPGSLYHNMGNGNHWLRVELVGMHSNRSGIGARVWARSGDLAQMQEILGGTGRDQNEMVAHFGLGERTQVDHLEIRWPSGQVDVLTDIPVDQRIRVFEGREGYYMARPALWAIALPETLVVGARFTLRATVQPALFERGAEITSVVADLSQLGGLKAAPLQAAEDGTWRLESLSLAIEGLNGLRSLSVLIDQTTSLGPYWTQLSRQVVVVPAGDLVIFDEVLADTWQAEVNRKVKEWSLSQPGVVYRGSLAGAFKVEGGALPWEVVFKPAKPVETAGYTALRFAFHSGDVSLPDEPILRLRLKPGVSVSLLQEGLVDVTVKQWQAVEVPLNRFALGGPMESLSLSGNFAGTFYLDDIRLVAATPSPVTVVEEDRTTALPQSFSLSQNFPNPFNSETVIRFALPASAEVELSVYNLAGQQVAKLAEGTREAGSYTVRWDGQDERGEELASGVYLYRLRVGEKVETRKLALVR